MAYIDGGRSKDGASATDTTHPQYSSYIELSDTLADIKGAGYFDEWPLLEAGTLILAKGSDGIQLLKVLTLNPVTVDDISSLPIIEDGAVLFGQSGEIAQDQSNFFWNTTANRLGLGTSSPGSKLEISNTVTAVAIADMAIIGGSTGEANIQLGLDGGITAEIELVTGGLRVGIDNPVLDICLQNPTTVEAGLLVRDPINSKQLTIQNDFSGGEAVNLQLSAGNTAAATILFGDTDSDFSGSISYVHTLNAMLFKTDGNPNPIMVLDDNQGVVIGSLVASTALILQLDSTTKAFAPPRMNEAQRDAISSPPDGSILFNTTTGEHNYRDTTWKSFISGGVYGNIYISATATTVIASTGVYVKIAGTTASDLLNDFTMPVSNRLTYGGVSTQVFNISANICVQTVSATDDFTVAIFKNGTLVTSSESQGHTMSSANCISVTTTALISLAQNDFVEAFIKNDTDTDNFTAMTMNFVATQID